MSTITWQRRQEIESISKDILTSTHGPISAILPPVDLNKILDKYGLKLKAGKFADGAIAGVYERDTYTIYLSEDDPIQRQTFTVGHELGHFFLHQHKQKDIFRRVDAFHLDTTRGTDKIEEAEANFFAAVLLIPTDLIRTYWLVMKEIEHLATLFGISETAVFWRLKNLGLIDTL